MTGSFRSAVFTADFHQEFEAETRSLLRKRFLWFCGIMVGLGILSFVFVAVLPLLFREQSLQEILIDAFGSRSRVAFWFGLSVLWMLMYASAMALAWLDRLSDDVLLRVTMVVVTADGLMNLAMRAIDFGGPGLFGFMISHLIAAALLPWTVRQALIPAVIVLGMSAASWLLIETENIIGALLLIGFSPFTALPGTLVAWLRHSRRLERSKMGFLGKRYKEMRRELVDARRLHEAMFPEPRDYGPLRFTYHYEPMHQIGGDYLFIASGPTGDDRHESLSVVVIDVTGHGIPAALTVNRLHGELERVFAENPTITPGEVLTLLNRYVHLTLSTHSVYVTAICARINTQASSLEYASGGHPPAFVRSVDGKLHELSSTSYILGACEDDRFDHSQQQIRFGPGDAFIAYTDGAIEARKPGGPMFGIRGIQGVLLRDRPDVTGGWPMAIHRSVAGHRAGPPADDTLVIEVVHPVAPSHSTTSDDDSSASQTHELGRASANTGA